MQEEEIIKGVAETITEKPKLTVTIDVKRRTWLDRLLRRPKARVFVVKPTTVATMLIISGHAGLMDSGLLQAALQSEKNRIPAMLAAIHANLKDVIFGVATIIQNNGEEPAAKLLQWLSKNTDALDLAEIIVPVLGSTYMQVFLNSIVLVKGTESILKPKTSPGEQGEMIAPGE
ncbi:hypothetical protein I2I11_04205 [Pontibacter sp. 172403-2]|uniref:hypothetical protein n=1 Tax=Pontibacter rufus TaxID=2791028 RepID=UPI0018AFF25F|nr:hypothetical protein [Pontibacter sp. 172403-2]MBF9252487.1 hypothetical protein [Pontibacter sp. 172403-2]